MKAITIRQPWTSLIAAGVKTIETRPRRTSYRGRIAIHAGKARPEQGAIIGQYIVDWGLDPVLTRATSGTPHLGDGCGYLLIDDEMNPTPLPLGAVVASAVLTDCVPIVGEDEDLDRDSLDRACIEHRPPGAMNAGLWLWPVEDEGEDMAEPADVSRQLPYGDYTPGRWALLLDDIAPTTERCPACWGTAWSALCGRTDDGSDGPCVMRERHSGPCYGENDVASDWSPVLPCRTCCFCPCGSTSDGTECRYCGVTRTPGRCDPIPARGQQAVPWEWDAEGADRG